VEQIETLLQKEDVLGFLKAHVRGDLKFHHEFRVALADCPNACSQPQIKDIGIIGACSPELTAEACTLCEACTEACREDAITLGSNDECPHIDYEKCLYCGKCMQVCPTGTIVEGAKGFRVQLGGKLGRHPRLARELPGIYTEQQVLEIVKDCLRFYKQTSKHGERFAQIFTPSDFEALAQRHRK
jgi:dissimilatory sulfite reductase (desulfoviridin) alpha/beta subunit